MQSASASMPTPAGSKRSRRCLPLGAQGLPRPRARGRLASRAAAHGSDATQLSRTVVFPRLPVCLSALRRAAFGGSASSAVTASSAMPRAGRARCRPPGASATRARSTASRAFRASSPFRATTLGSFPDAQPP
eukprot:15435307-Alexandrium_andersonii.AAC.1